MRGCEAALPKETAEVLFSPFLIPALKLGTSAFAPSWDQEDLSVAVSGSGLGLLGTCSDLGAIAVAPTQPRKRL